MIDSILARLATSSYDFRRHANPDDPLAALFPDWVPYYRLKFAIAQALQPRSILEIGVRFGYSAVTFLEANPSAHLVGIDLDVDTFGGQKGALEWARKITADYNAEFLVADSQQMKRFPGGIYDLIHVDGQQDGTGTFHDLRRAVSQARWVLLDGYFWTHDNFFNANDFLLKFKDIISYSLVIPGYAGELLLRVSDSYLATVGEVASSGAAKSEEIVGFYDSAYYLTDCGGYQTYRQFRGKQIEDQRLLSLLALAGLVRTGAALDLGCGRGEMAYQLAARGFDVTAIDYSAASIDLAKRCFVDASEAMRRRVRFLCADASTFPYEQEFEFVVAGDLIEHLSPAELERLYESVARHLKGDGVFVIHTAPNKWFHDRTHRRRKASVERLGGYMPAEPRTRYELLMHINEQSPAVLRRSLSRFFPHVKVWLADARGAGESLRRNFNFGEKMEATEIYAIASHAPIDLTKARDLLTTPVIRHGEHAKIQLRVEHWPARVKPGELFLLPVDLRNRSAQMLSSLNPFPVRLAYHWFSEDRGRAIVWDGLRSSLPMSVLPGQDALINVQVEAPNENGRLFLCVTLVQEGQSWFDEQASECQAEALIDVGSS